MDNFNPNYIMNTKQLYLAPEAEPLTVQTEGMVCASETGLEGGNIDTVTIEDWGVTL